MRLPEMTRISPPARIPGPKRRALLACAAAAQALLLAACHSQPSTAPREPAAQADLIACASGNAQLSKACTVELTPGPQGAIVTVHNPDGGFHRLLVTKDGRGVIAADGAQPARVTTVDADTIEVAIGPDRYRLPATVKGQSTVRGR